MSVYSVPSLVSNQENLIDPISSFAVFPSPVSMEDPVLGISLVTLDRHRILLNQPQMSASAKYDIAFKIWVPLIDCLFGGQSPIVTKIFKIDFRTLYHHHHHRHGSQVIDLAAGEAAKKVEETKVKMDHGKLAREAKDILDRLIMTNIDGGHYALKGTAVQLAGKRVANNKNGLQGEISTIHLHDSGPYVLLPESRLSFPQSYVSLNRFLPTMKALLQLRVWCGQTKPDET
ncbi:hypothetical protein [Absidia glauca]|uniref:Uncharacterized protein n=1 Tax=Absidia glauca TaxID=4829 RepID=A0A168PRP8_ABSGL|nr:hypothetical protein [Absidia glauca]